MSLAWCSSTWRNTWRNVAVGLPVRARRQRPAKRSTSAGSVISVSVFARRRAGAGDRDQQQLVAAAEQVDLLVVGQGGPAEHFKRLGRQDSRAPGRRPAEQPHDQQEDSQHHGQTAADGRQPRRVRPAACSFPSGPQTHEASAPATRSAVDRPPASRRWPRSSGGGYGNDLGRQSRADTSRAESARSFLQPNALCAFPCVL